MEQGSKNRTTGFTQSNENSSRSHLVYTIYVTGVNKLDGT